MIRSFQALITACVLARHDAYHYWPVIAATKALGYFNVVNTTHKAVQFQLFYNPAINQTLDIGRDYQYWITAGSGRCAVCECECECVSSSECVSENE
jgi:hypothetical protein